MFWFSPLCFQNSRLQLWDRMKPQLEVLEVKVQSVLWLNPRFQQSLKLLSSLIKCTFLPNTDEYYCFLLIVTKVYQMNVSKSNSICLHNVMEYNKYEVVFYIAALSQWVQWQMCNIRGQQRINLIINIYTHLQCSSHTTVKIKISCYNIYSTTWCDRFSY